MLTSKQKLSRCGSENLSYHAGRDVQGLRNAGRPIRRPDLCLLTADHNVPTTSRKNFTTAAAFISDPESRLQVSTLNDNIEAFKLPYFGLADQRQGIGTLSLSSWCRRAGARSVHVIGPEQGFTLPCSTIVCGDSHTSTHGAFGALAFGIGTSEVEHVLATQTILQKRARNMRVRVNGHLGAGVTSKDIVLHIIGVIGTAGGTGSVIEFCGDAISRLSMESRMSICNMCARRIAARQELSKDRSIEAGARAGLIAPDDITFDYLRDRPLAPKGAEWDAAVKYWKSMVSDADAVYDISVDIKAEDIAPTVSWGTSPQDVVAISAVVPDPATIEDADKRKSVERALEYMALTAGTKMEDIAVDKVRCLSCST